MIYRAGNNDYYDNLQERIKAANQGVNGALPRRQRQEDPKPIPPRPRMVRKESNPPPPKQQPKPVQFQSFKKHPKPSPTEEPKYFSHVLRSPQSPVPNSILSEP